MQSQPFEPNWASPPGDTILDILEFKEIPLRRFLDNLCMNFAHGSKLLNGTLPIDTTLAEKLGELLGPNTQFWINREANYRSDLKRIDGMQKDRIILDYIETMIVKHNYTFTPYYLPNNQQPAWRVYDGSTCLESTEVIGSGPTLREAVENAIEHPYGN